MQLKMIFYVNSFHDTGSKNMQETTLQALMIDDSEDDVLLTVRALTKGGYNIRNHW